ncbi:MAG: hypothetical protein ACLFV2_06640 [Desulfurivibrionaceae bacterium]
MLRHGGLCIAALLSAILVEGFAAAPLWGRINLKTELDYSNSNSEIEQKDTGETRETENSRFVQTYNLDISRRIFPLLTVDGGGFFELTEGDSETVEQGSRTSSDREERVIRPYAGITLDNNLYQAGLDYRKTDTRTTTNNREDNRYLDDYSARLQWRPVDLPRVRMDYSRTEIKDEPSSSTQASRRSSEQITDDFNLRSRYSYNNYLFRYYLSHSDSDLRQTRSREDRTDIQDRNQLSTTHIGTVQYGRDFLDRRINLGAGGRIRQSSTEATGRGEVRERTPLGNYFFLPPDRFDPDHPVTDPDNDFSSPDAVDIGPQVRETPPDMGFGLDFTLPAQVDTVYANLETDPGDPELASPPEIAGIDPEIFNWRIWVSNDQINWEIHDDSPTVEFDQLENRYEISFAAADYRFLMITLEPLAAEEYPLTGEINITGLETFTTTSLTESRPKSETDSLEQNYNLNLTGRITENTTSRYSFFFRQRNTDPGDRQTTLLTNSISLSHIFNSVFSGRSRLLRSDNTQSGARTEEIDETRYSYSAALEAGYLKTFRQTLSYSGSTSRTEEGTSSRDSVLLRTAADLYEGWSANLDLGYSRNTPAEGGETTATRIRAATRLRPNPKTNINLDYSISQSSGGQGDDRRTDRGSLRFQFLPTRALSLFARYTYKDEEGEDPRWLQDYRLGWSPFPDGALQCSLNYSHRLYQDDDDKEERIYSARTRWRVRRGLFLELTGSLGDIEDSREIRDFYSSRANLRVAF